MTSSAQTDDLLAASLQTLRISGVGTGRVRASSANAEHVVSLTLLIPKTKAVITKAQQKEWEKLTRHEQQQLQRAPGGSFARWVQDGYYWDYNNLNLRMEYVDRRYTLTAENIYNALWKYSRVNPQWLVQSRPAPQVALLGCGAAPERVAVKAFLEHKWAVTNAVYGLLDKADWLNEWQAQDMVNNDRVVKFGSKCKDLDNPNQSLWDILAGCQLIVGWFVHETIEDFTGQRMQLLVSKGAVILYGCPQRGHKAIPQAAPSVGRKMWKYTPECNADQQPSHCNSEHDAIVSYFKSAVGHVLR